MPPQFDLTDRLNAGFAPLCALGHALWERGELDSLRTFGAIPQKSCVHTPGEKLLDAFLVILAGYPSLYLLNTALRLDHCSPKPGTGVLWLTNRFRARLTRYA